MKLVRYTCLSFVLLTFTSSIFANSIKVAVASNFINAAKIIAKNFEKETKHRITLIFGSTGKHYAQIINGAPYDLFFAADIERPKLLEDEGYAVKDSRFTYALGQIVLWSPEKDLQISQATLSEKNDRQIIAIANPRLAPYGRAARQVLEHLQLWIFWQKQMVRGENISQTYQFIRTGNADLGFIAYSQLKFPNKDLYGSLWIVPQNLYSPVEQQAVALRKNNVANAFLNYFKTERVRNLILEYGYKVPLN